MRGGKVRLWAALSLALLLILVACTPQGAPAPTPTAPAKAQASQAPAKPEAAIAPWGDWDKVIELAKQEGKVNIYSFTIPPAIKMPMMKVFREKYGITLEFVSGTGTELSEKIMAEHRGKAFVADVFETGLPEHLYLKKEGLTVPINLPETQDASVWKQNPRYGDPGGYTFSYGFFGVGPMINTKLVKPEDEPKSWFDLLDPKWKSKMCMFDPSLPGVGARTFQTVKNYIADESYWRKMAAQDIRFSRVYRELVDGVVKGDYYIFISAPASVVLPPIKAGAPVKIIALKEGTYSAGWTLSLLKNSPHPNAARVFINWFVSKEGQTVYSQLWGFPSSRTDVTQEHVPQAFRWGPELKVIPLSAAEEAPGAREAEAKLAVEIFGLRR